MRQTYSFKILYSILSVGIYTTAIAQLPEYWKDRTSKLGEVTIIKNPKKPFFKNDLFLLKEEIMISGNGTSVEESFSSVSDISVDSGGRIYIGDPKSSEIKIFNNSGKFVRNFGRKGQGPGEFIRPMTLSFCDLTNELFIQDRVRGLFFDSYGNYLRSIPLRINYEAIKLDALGNMRGVIQVREKNGEKEELRIFDIDGNPEKLVAETPIKNQLNPFPPYMTWCIRRDGTIIEGYPETYEFCIHDHEGNVAKRIYKESDPIEVTDEWRQAYLKSRSRSNISYRIPRYQPAYSSMFSDEKGWIFIGTLKKGSNPKQLVLDIFDENGYYLNEVSWPMGATMIKNEKLYSIQFDEEGYSIVRRFALITKNDSTRLSTKGKY